MNYEEISRDVSTIAQKAGEFILSHFNTLKPGDIRHKEKNELVSFVDIESEKMIIAELSRLIPGSLFIAEESAKKTETEKDKYYWIVDPLDGTTNYLSSIPVFSTSIALLCNNSLKIGVIHDPYHSECFHTWENGLSYLNDSPIRVSDQKQLAESLIATGFPYKSFNKLEPYLDILKYLLQNTRGIRRLGSAALDLAYVACGKFEAFYEYNLNAWDLAAGALLVKNAGGMVTDFEGKDNYLFGRTLIASNPSIVAELTEIIRSRFIS